MKGVGCRGGGRRGVEARSGPGGGGGGKGYGAAAGPTSQGEPE